MSLYNVFLVSACFYHIVSLTGLVYGVSTRVEKVTSDAAILGGNTALRCVVQGMDVTSGYTITWHHGDTTIPRDTPTKYLLQAENLVIKNLLKQDGGQWSCDVYDEMSKKSVSRHTSSLTLAVACKCYMLSKILLSQLA